MSALCILDWCICFCWCSLFCSCCWSDWTRCERFYIEFQCVDCELVIEYCTWMCFLAKQHAGEPKRLEISLGWDFTVIDGFVQVWKSVVYNHVGWNLQKKDVSEYQVKGKRLVGGILELKAFAIDSWTLKACKMRAFQYIHIAQVVYAQLYCIMHNLVHWLRIVP